MLLKKFYKPATISYIICIVLINYAFSLLPIYTVHGCDISPMDPVAGIIYLFRDFAQRELGHKVFIAMIIGAIISYLLATPMIALASISAFAAAEIIDWAIFTFTQKPLSKRLLWSASLSAPIDSAIFLAMINRYNFLAVVVMTASKIAGILVMLSIWRRKQSSKGQFAS